MSRAFAASLPGFGALILAGHSLPEIASRLARGNPRVLYGLSHLPVALGWIALASVAALLAVRATLRNGLGRTISRAQALAIIAVTYLAVWLPAWWSGGFVMDDWRLLASASVRKLVVAHPLLSLRTLDAVDGNFRPLGTVLYFGYMLRWFGASAAHLFTLGPLLLTMVSVFVAYAIVVELGYPLCAAVAAAVLFATRGMLYTVVTWTAALGDSISLALCGASALLLLRACRTAGWRVAALHGLAWLAFAIATLGKQSAFAMPLIAGLILWMRPGRCAPAARARRTLEAAAAIAVYGVTAAVVFWHAKGLLRAPSPYPIRLTPAALLHLFAYPTWYLAVLQLPAKWGDINLPAEVFGVALLAIAIWIAVRRGQAAVRGGRDWVFALLAGVASLWLLALLQTRAAPYYGGMFAFWVSIALGIALFPNESGRRVLPRRAAVLAVVLLAWSGYCEVRIEQTGLMPSGGYVWGSFNPAQERGFREALDGQLKAAGATRTVLFVRCADRISYAPMVLLDAPGVEDVLVDDPARGGFFANNREGRRPSDDLAGLTDPGAYSWTVPLDADRARGILARGSVLEVPCSDGELPPEMERR